MASLQLLGVIRHYWANSRTFGDGHAFDVAAIASGWLYYEICLIRCFRGSRQVQVELDPLQCLISKPMRPSLFSGQPL
jgi:hypothetical protein